MLTEQGEKGRAHDTGQFVGQPDLRFDFVVIKKHQSGAQLRGAAEVCGKNHVFNRKQKGRDLKKQASADRANMHIAWLYLREDGHPMYDQWTRELLKLKDFITGNTV